MKRDEAEREPSVREKDMKQSNTREDAGDQRHNMDHRVLGIWKIQIGFLPIHEITLWNDLSLVHSEASYLTKCSQNWVNQKSVHFNTNAIL